MDAIGIQFLYELRPPAQDLELVMGKIGVQAQQGTPGQRFKMLLLHIVLRRRTGCFDVLISTKVLP